MCALGLGATEPVKWKKQREPKVSRQNKKTGSVEIHDGLSGQTWIFYSEKTLKKV